MGHRGIVHGELRADSRSVIRPDDARVAVAAVKWRAPRGPVRLLGYELPADHKAPVYNPMTGTRRDIEVEREDGDAARKTHDRWTRLRIAALERLLEGTCTELARGCYERELTSLRKRKELTR